MTNDALKTYYQTWNGKTATEVKNEIVRITDGSAAGVTAHFNAAVLGPDVKDDIVKLSVLLTIYFNKSDAVITGATDAITRAAQILEAYEDVFSVDPGTGAAMFTGDVYADGKKLAVDGLVTNPLTQEITVNAVDSDKFIRYTNGEVGETQIADTYWVSDFVTINGFSQLAVKIPRVMLDNPVSGYAFYDADKVFIPKSGIQSLVGYDFTAYTADDVIIDIPSGAYHVRFTMLSESFKFTAISQEDAAKNAVDEPFKKSIKVSGLKWENGFYNALGVYYNDPTLVAVQRSITSDPIYVPVGTKIGFSGVKAKSGVSFVVWVIELDDSDQFVKRTPIFSPNVDAFVVTKNPKIRFGYALFNAPESEGMRIWPTDGRLFNVTETTPAGVASDEINVGLLRSERITSAGVQNAVLNARQFTDIRWTPLANMPGILRNESVTPVTYDYTPFTAGVRQTGIPYSRQDVNGRQVAMNIGFSAFLTACLNPNSYLYTKNEYDASLKRATYYGVVCSKMVQAAWGLPEIFNSQEFDNLVEVEVGDSVEYRVKGIPSIKRIAAPGQWDENDVQIGDGVLDPDKHCTLCTDILRDANGVVRAIEISEAITPSCVRRTWAIKDFFDHFASYGLYRYDGIDSVKYHKNPYIDLEDGFTGVTDLPIGIREGSFVNIQRVYDPGTMSADIEPGRWIRLHIVHDGQSSSVDIGSEATTVSLPIANTGHYDVYPEDANGNFGNTSSYFVYAVTNETYSKDGSALSVDYRNHANGDAKYLVFYNNDSTRHSLVNLDNSGTVETQIPTGMTKCRIYYESEYGIFFGNEHTL